MLFEMKCEPIDVFVQVRKHFMVCRGLLTKLVAYIVLLKMSVQRSNVEVLKLRVFLHICILVKDKAVLCSGFKIS